MADRVRDRRAAGSPRRTCGAGRCACARAPTPSRCPGRPSWQRSARNVCASALPCREKRSLPRAIRYPIGKLPSSSQIVRSAVPSSTALSGISAVMQRQLGAVDVPHRARGRTRTARPIGQNGLSCGARHGLMSEWYSAVENTVSRSADAASTVIALQLLAPRLLGAVPALAEPGGPDAAVAPEVRARLLDAAQREADAHLDALARLAGAGPHQAERRRVVGRMWSNASRVPPGMSRRSYQSIWRQALASHSM